MESRTRAYLRGRFRDYYRNQKLSPPPGSDSREWGYIPFSPDGTTMVRHRSLLEMGSLDEFLTRERPRHVYFSAGYYEDPGASTMEGKTWLGSDLVFDLDADHLPGVDPTTTTYSDMLAACKSALDRLLSFLRSDFGFNDLTIVFSGGRGYHVHVRDEDVTDLHREDRREIVEYVRGIDVDFERIVETQTVAGTAGRSSPAQKRTIDTRGGWGRRVGNRIEEFVTELMAADEDEAIDELTEYSGIGDGKASAICQAIDNNQEEIQQGNVDVHPAFISLARELTDETVRNERAPIDEPVTTDTHRLIRLPGSLHGGSGLQVTHIKPGELAEFDPLVDPIPPTFKGHEIAIKVTDCSGLPPFDDPDGGIVELAGNTFRMEAGTQYYPEYLGIFLMCRGRAEKAKE